MTRVLIALCLMAATAAAQEAAKVTPLITQELTGMVDGKEGTLILVEYAPGGADTQHRHNAYAFVYVLEGTVVMQVQGGKEMTLGRARRSPRRRPTSIRSPGMPAPRSRPGSWRSS